METQAPSILTEVRDFLVGLKTDWPELFPRKVSLPLSSPSVAVPVVPPSALIAAVSGDELPKTALPSVDLVALFRSRAEFYAPLLGVSFGRISVKDQRSLWGSCTRQGNLNFSWRLALAPDSVLDYVVVHELAHRAQMNHSRRFWEVVERVCPGHRTHRRWLRKNGRALYSVPRP